MQANGNDVFTHEIARRSVARAALHLGIDRMSEEALDILADVLVTYLQRISCTLSQLVESSNRTSAHVNVLDALRAVDMCTSPAVHQLHLEGAQQETLQQAGWKDLASFLFGPNWMQEETTQPEAGGKVGPSSVMAKKAGWHAPYLDEIPPYPQALQACANPHTLGRQEALSLYGQVALSPTHEQEEAWAEMPDEAFTTEWGVVSSQRDNEKKNKAQRDHEDAPPAKRAKLQDDKAASMEGLAKEDEEKTTVAEEESKKPRAKETKSERPAYVPSFLPPFPNSGPGRAIAVANDDGLLPAASTKPTAASTTALPTDPLDVRSSLVKMEQSYWGSGWDSEATKVPPGRRPPTEKEKEKAEKQKVAPLERPSLSRISRILEGSMDAAT